jgi:hypothetical protein
LPENGVLGFLVGLMAGAHFARLWREIEVFEHENSGCVLPLL